MRNVLRSPKQAALGKKSRRTPIAMRSSISVSIEYIYLSPGHIYFGRHGQKSGDSPVVEVNQAFCVSGRGIQGDRFFDYKKSYKGQITFFSMEVFEDLCRKLAISGKAPSAVRRNILARGLDLNLLIGRKFVLQGICFEGTEECRPCHWMDEAMAPGAEELLKGRGGLRARILNDGYLKAGANQEWRVLEDLP